MRNPILENEISDIILEFAYNYHETFDSWTTSDLQ